MKFNLRLSRRAADRARAAFTLAEVLAALVFMAIVIPVAVDAMRVANLAGQVGLRKAAAARVADRVLNEWRVTSASQSIGQVGTAREGVGQYRWVIRSTPWTEDTVHRMNLVTVVVTFQVQGREYDVQLSTLVSQGTL